MDCERFCVYHCMGEQFLFNLSYHTTFFHSVTSPKPPDPTVRSSVHGPFLFDWDIIMLCWKIDTCTCNWNVNKFVIMYRCALPEQTWCHILVCNKAYNAQTGLSKTYIWCKAKNKLKQPFRLTLHIVISKVGFTLLQETK